MQQGLSHDNMSDKRECRNIKSVTYRYYINVRTFCPYYDIYYCISFAMYNVGYVLLFLYVVHTMTFN